MQYYSAKVRLSGSPLNEVQKVLSAPEILVLQYIHGVDALIHIEPCKKETIDLREEKKRLKGLYDQALVKREQSIDTIFGPLGSVPEQLPSDLIERFNIVDDEDVIAVAKAVTNSDKKHDHSQTMTQVETDRMDAFVPTEEVDFNELAG